MKQLPAVDIKEYGTLQSGEPVAIARITNGPGMELDVISYGGIITRLLAPDSSGNFQDVVLGLDSLDDYQTFSNRLGAIIGRFGNRIAEGKFELSGDSHQLEINNGRHHLHGGSMGFNKLNWSMLPFRSTDAAGVVLSLTSPDGDQGYPGELCVQVTYTLGNDNNLNLSFNATTSKSTIINLTHHSFFNLASKGDILDHQLMIPATSFTPLNDNLIPTGEFRDVAGTAFDFTKPKTVGKDIDSDDQQLKIAGGYDHNWVLKSRNDEQLIPGAILEEDNSGRILEVWTDHPGMQFYSGNFLDGTMAGKGRKLSCRSGLCLEPQSFPNSPNQVNFPSTLLNPGETYQRCIQYRFRHQQ